MVFFGEVLEETTYVKHTERGPLPEGVQAVRFNVIRSFKEVDRDEFDAMFYYGVEAKPFSPGARYLVVADRRATGAFVTGCTLTREIAKAEEGTWLRTGAVELDACFKDKRR